MTQLSSHLFCFLSIKHVLQLDVSLLLGLDHKGVFKVKDNDRRVPGRILGQVDLYILAITDEYIFGYTLVFVDNKPPLSSFLI